MDLLIQSLDVVPRLCHRYSISGFHFSWVNAKFFHSIKQGATFDSQAKRRAVRPTDAAVCLS